MGFPEGFLWGVATSAQQIEGAVDEDGRGESIWDRFATVSGNIADGSDPRVACDHFHRWREDIELMRMARRERLPFLGRVAARAAARRGPSSTRAGLDFYDALIDALLAAGIRPFVTLDHWDLPQPLQDRGGWTSRDTVERFVEFADVVSARLGDRVPHWITHNEPWCISHLGYEAGVHAPGLRDPAASLRVAHHLLLSHGRAAGAAATQRARTPKLGIVLILSPVHAASDSAADRDAARRLDGTFNRWFLDPLFRGAYPADVLADRVRLGHVSGEAPDFVQPATWRASPRRPTSSA